METTSAALSAAATAETKVLRSVEAKEIRLAQHWARSMARESAPK